MGCFPAPATNSLRTVTWCPTSPFTPVTNYSQLTVFPSIVSWIWRCEIHYMEEKLYSLFYAILYKGLSICGFWYPGLFETIPHGYQGMTVPGVRIDPRGQGLKTVPTFDAKSQVPGCHWYFWLAGCKLGVSITLPPRFDHLLEWLTGFRKILKFTSLFKRLQLRNSLKRTGRDTQGKELEVKECMQLPYSLWTWHLLSMVIYSPTQKVTKLSYSSVFTELNLQPSPLPLSWTKVSEWNWTFQL